MKYTRVWGGGNYWYKSIMRKRLLVLLAIVVILSGGIYLRQAVMVASLSSRPFQAAVVEPLDKLEPALLENHSEQLVASAVYEGLVSYDDKEGRIRPLLADSWEYADEGKTLNIELKKEAKFSNGTPVTASAVKKAWEKNISASKEWASQYMFLRIAGTNEFINGGAADISGIQAPQEHSLQITLTKPDTAFIYVLTNPIFWVADSSSGALCGTGPYILNKASPDNVVLLRNEQYYGELAHLAAISFNRYQDETQALAAYRDGKIDYLDDLPLQVLPEIAADSKNKGLYIEKPLMEVYWLGFNLEREPYKNNYLLRRALNYAVDREAIVKNIMGGGFLPAKGVIPAGSSAYNGQMRGYTYNPDKVQELLAEAGYPNGKGLNPLTLTYNADPGHRQIAVEVARQLGLQGIAVQVQENEWDFYTKQLTNKQLSFFRLGWRADYADADNLLYTLFHGTATEGSNLTGYHNPQVDKLLDDARAEYKDDKARIKLLKKAEEIIVDDAPCLWLFQKKATILIGKDVRDFKVDCLGLVNWHKVELVSF
ncbi:MAG: ABC transporter substrate-binding protein [Syntrophomonadaceae bacterium]|nr:ABC transporter substrate-binding protein [Syntrophomonadaceae bacterium]